MFENYAIEGSFWKDIKYLSYMLLLGFIAVLTIVCAGYLFGLFMDLVN